MGDTGVRLMIYDVTQGALTGAWYAGGALYRLMRRIDAVHGARNWDEALAWAAATQPDRPIAEIQIWAHGRWGSVSLDGERMTDASLADGHAHRPRLDALRERMTPESLWWFRTCETFGADSGQRFARAWTDFFGCRAAGHTYIVADWQSGLHSLAPGATPSWDRSEGLKEGTPDAPKKARYSRPWAPNTIHCLRGALPSGL